MEHIPSRFWGYKAYTSALHARGMFTHQEINLFETEPSPLFEAFLDTVFAPDTNSLAKCIRASGRLEAFLKGRDKLKIIHIVRNPLDVLNSSLTHFSLFGSEFHPSDEPRFDHQARDLFPQLYNQKAEQTEAEKHLQWWRLMNEAALDTADKYPDRVLIIAHEHLTASSTLVMKMIAAFLELDEHIFDDLELNESVGPTTPDLTLKSKTETGSYHPLKPTFQILASLEKPSKAFAQPKRYPPSWTNTPRVRMVLRFPFPYPLKNRQPQFVLKPSERFGN